MVASARGAAMIATPKPAMPSATTHPLLMLGGRLIAVAQLVTTATVASPLTGARLVGTRSTRLIATPHSTERAANASPTNMWPGLWVHDGPRPITPPPQLPRGEFRPSPSTISQPAT